MNVQAAHGLKRLQLTLAMLKPDVMAQPPVVKSVRDMILANNFYIVKSVELQMNREKAGLFYKEHKERFFYNRLVSHISSGRTGVHILAGDEAILRWRQLMGPTKVFKSVHEAPDSIRGLFGLTDTRNAAHGSDSDESATREIEFFFPDFNIEQWYSNSEELFRTKPLTFDSSLLVHKPEE